MAQLDEQSTGDQEVAGSTPAGSATFFHGDWSWNILYCHSLPSADSRRAVVSFWAQVLVNCLEDYACPGKVWLGKLTMLDMTLMGWLGRKTSTQTIHSYYSSVSNDSVSELFWCPCWSGLLLSDYAPKDSFMGLGSSLLPFLTLSLLSQLLKWTPLSLKLNVSII